MKVKKFKARTGSPFKKKDAQKVGEELEKIKEKENLTPVSVVERAKNKKSILHKLFEWDDSEAAEQFRLQQARQIVNHVVEIVVIRGNEVEEKAYFNVVAKEGGNIYESLAEVIKVPSYKKQLLKEMETTMENLLRLIKLFSSMQ